MFLANCPGLAERYSEVGSSSKAPKLTHKSCRRHEQKSSLLCAENLGMSCKIEIQQAACLRAVTSDDTDVAVFQCFAEQAQILRLCAWNPLWSCLSDPTCIACSADEKVSSIAAMTSCVNLAKHCAWRSICAACPDEILG